MSAGEMADQEPLEERLKRDPVGVVAERARDIWGVDHETSGGAWLRHPIRVLHPEGDEIGEFCLTPRGTYYLKIEETDGLSTNSVDLVTLRRDIGRGGQPSKHWVAYRVDDFYDAVALSSGPFRESIVESKAATEFIKYLGEPGEPVTEFMVLPDPDDSSPAASDQTPSPSAA